MIRSILLVLLVGMLGGCHTAAGYWLPALWPFEGRGHDIPLPPTPTPECECAR